MMGNPRPVSPDFSAFEPGKPEHMLGMLEWANRRGVGPVPRPLPIAVALGCLAEPVWQARRPLAGPARLLPSESRRPRRLP